MSLIKLAEKGVLPDRLIRMGIRYLLRQRLATESANDVQLSSERKAAFIDELRSSPIAIETAAANEQHYEIPAAFYSLVLGSHLKYSGCWWQSSALSLADAEQAMLEKYVERGQFHNGQDILELGCGWGSLTLYLAQRFSRSKITAVSNSASQRRFIEEQAKDRGLTNIRVITEDVNQLTLGAQFDRIVSIEMFEHMRNYQKLFDNIAGWLREDGKLFIHIFCHRSVVYPFETEGEDNWMGRYFFTGGLMPSADTLLHFQNKLNIEKQWLVSGSHYEKTANAWLSNTDKHASQISQLFDEIYGPQQGEVWLQRWRLFFMACAELFGYRNGQEWLVSHYLFSKPTA
ncbi:Cyclopropane-fatty-acyl-phospholipid synthase-like protein [Methylophaga frappieri]|uniref:Cyclopropane-fatty-acyl-phospholipid synthase-like protein n=1 Tax=Methylophaga frappieri (strain ATCC BAA-2434 / DSM 25690 / JAM7) TaxID=754477 RepID=I1YF17_METFJ|nr:cyclopropane-fatty-acyl-phospholipid synthase family protein [Methylophaga frappieri]AFJ01510.1 Cyclopropane-fatty-acyl-phospholipid synthase-like protein [Methylophaga frappieri]